MAEGKKRETASKEPGGSIMKDVYKDWTPSWEKKDDKKDKLPRKFRGKPSRDS